MKNSFSSLGNTRRLSVSTSSAADTLPGTNGDVVRVHNFSSSVAFIKFGVAGLVAVADQDTFLAPGATEVFSIPPGTTHVAAILAAGTGAIYFQRGAGA